MLASPDRTGNAGFVRSIREHNNSHTQFCDWLEGSALVDGAVSYPDVIDFLGETHVYDSDDLAWEFLESVRSETQRRALLLFLLNTSHGAVRRGGARPGRGSRHHHCRHAADRAGGGDGVDASPPAARGHCANAVQDAVDDDPVSLT